MYGLLMTTFNELVENEKNSLQQRKANVHEITEKEFKKLKMSEKLTLALCNVANVNKKRGNANQTCFLEERSLMTRHFDKEKESNGILYISEKLTDLGLSVINYYEKNGYPVSKKIKKIN
jgi:Cdc6-like AAA superfamily ATPase